MIVNDSDLMRNIRHRDNANDTGNGCGKTITLMFQGHMYIKDNHKTDNVCNSGNTKK
jgi:hypothetical protein